MQTFTTNKEEELNLETFASPVEEKTYNHYVLKGEEKILFAKYFIKKGTKILDIGCGYGRTTRPLHEMGFNVVGIDIVSRMIETAKKENPEIDFRLMNAAELNFPDKTFDYVLFSFNGLDYLYPGVRREKALAEIRRVLKPGGTFILSSHNKMCLFTGFSLYHLKVVLRNLLNGRIFTNYIKEKYGGGYVIAYFKMPYLQKKEYKKVGFDVLEIIGRKNKGFLKINLFESWCYYILRKREEL